MKIETTISAVVNKTSREAPEWLPPPGQYAKVPMRNTLADTEPPIPPGTPKGLRYGRDFGGMRGEYTGATFSPDYSPLGAWVLGASGGHGAWWGNSLHIGDLSTLRFERIIDPHPNCLAPREIDLVYSDPDWRDHPDQSPSCPHRYAAIEHLPASWGVTGRKGAYMAFGCPGHSRYFFAHSSDLANPVWRRFTKDKLRWPHGGIPYGASTRDDLRQCFYTTSASQRAGSYHYKIEKDGTITQRPGGIGVTGAVTCMTYAPPPHDVVVSIGGQPGAMAITKPDEWVKYTPPFSGTPPAFASPNGFHPEWDPSRGCFVVWDPTAETCYKLFPPADPLAGTWRWTNEVLLKSTRHPPTNYGKDGGGQWSKVRYVPALSAFAYAPSMTELQIIRPSGA